MLSLLSKMKKQLFFYLLFLISSQSFSQSGRSSYEILLNSLRCDCHKKFIENRRSLQPIPLHFSTLLDTVTCFDSVQKLQFALQKEVVDTTRVFLHKKWISKKRKEYECYSERILVYGTDGNSFHVRLKQPLFKKDDQWIAMPEEEFNCFFEPDLKSIEAYASSDKKHIYIYMQGGIESKRYAVKWIIGAHKYITNIIGFDKNANFDFLDGLE